MARLELNLPESLPFSTELRLRAADINYAGHLGNDHLISLLQEARIRFLAHHGLQEMRMAGLVPRPGSLFRVSTVPNADGCVAPQLSTPGTRPRRALPSSPGPRRKPGTLFRVEELSFVITDVAAIYESEAFGGEVLRLEVGVADFNRYGCDFVFRVTEATTGRAVARAKTGMVFFDYDLRKVQPMPEEFRTLFGPEAKSSEPEAKSPEP